MKARFVCHSSTWYRGRCCEQLSLTLHRSFRPRSTGGLRPEGTQLASAHRCRLRPLGVRERPRFERRESGRYRGGGLRCEGVRGIGAADSQQHYFVCVVARVFAARRMQIVTFPADDSAIAHALRAVGAGGHEGTHVGRCRFAHRRSSQAGGALGCNKHHGSTGQTQKMECAASAGRAVIRRMGGTVEGSGGQALAPGGGIVNAGEALGTRIVQDKVYGVSLALFRVQFAEPDAHLLEFGVPVVVRGPMACIPTGPPLKPPLPRLLRRSSSHARSRFGCAPSCIWTFQELSMNLGEMQMHKMNIATDGCTTTRT